MSEEYSYVGNELDLFAEAVNWKKYYVNLVMSYIKGENILEVGAGIGEVTKHFCKGREYKSWLCVEPDSDMANEIDKKINDGYLPSFCRAKSGFLTDLDKDQLFDTILYIDVLEHIEDDKKEIEDALDHLNYGGRIIVVSPAHNWLYTPWDKAIGHYRRYNKESLLGLAPEGLICKKFKYIDSVGFFASLANKLILKTGNPKRAQIMFWDRVLIPLSRIFDKILFHKFGKNVVAMWEKQQG